MVNKFFATEIQHTFAPILQFIKILFTPGQAKYTKFQFEHCKWNK